jgi:hypothetical protein
LPDRASPCFSLSLANPEKKDKMGSIAMSVKEILEEIQKLSWIEKEHLRAALDSDEEHPAVLEAVDKGRLSLKAGPTYTADEVRAKLREWVSK